MDFKGPYLQAMRVADPGLFNALRRSGQLDDYVQQKTVEAYQYLEEMLAHEPKGPTGLPLDQQASRLAEERVMAQMLDFPQPVSAQTPEPPDDLPPQTSRVKTSSSLRVQ